MAKDLENNAEWQRPAWIAERYGIGRRTVERAWRAGSIRRAKLAAGGAGTVVYRVADIERWINDSIDDPRKTAPSGGAVPHPY